MGEAYTARQYLMAIHRHILATIDAMHPTGFDLLESETDHAAAVAARMGLELNRAGRYPVAVWMVVFR